MGTLSVIGALLAPPERADLQEQLSEPDRQKMASPHHPAWVQLGLFDCRAAVCTGENEMKRLVHTVRGELEVDQAGQ